MTKVTFPDSETILYEYGKEGELTKMTDTNGQVTRYTYYNDLRLHEVIIEKALRVRPRLYLLV